MEISIKNLTKYLRNVPSVFLWGGVIVLKLTLDLWFQGIFMDWFVTLWLGLCSLENLLLFKLVNSFFFSAISHTIPKEYQFFKFWPCHVACRILVPGAGIEPVSPAVEVRSPNHWTAREFPECQCCLLHNYQVRERYKL